MPHVCTCIFIRVVPALPWNVFIWHIHMCMCVCIYINVYIYVYIYTNYNLYTYSITFRVPYRGCYIYRVCIVRFISVVEHTLRCKCRGKNASDAGDVFLRFARYSFSPLKIAAFSGFPFRISSARGVHVKNKREHAVYAKSPGPVSWAACRVGETWVHVKINIRIKS